MATTCILLFLLSIDYFEALTALIIPRWLDLAELLAADMTGLQSFRDYEAPLLHCHRPRMT